jgi:hypothetical protein
MLRDENEFRQSENRLMRYTFVTNNEDVAEGRRKLHDEEFHDLHSLIYRYSMEMIK